ncbi:MAG: zinc-ribbon domain-containing protein [Methanomicrobiales archaeon]
MYCPNCGTENQEDAKFCEKCGAELVSMEDQMDENEEKNIPSKKDSIIDLKKKEGQTSKSGYILLIVGLLILISNFLVLGEAI